jgi:hypothetical protein
VARGLQPLHFLLAPGILGQVIDRHRGARAGEQLDRRKPDAGGAAGDQRGLAGEVDRDHACGLL